MKRNRAIFKLALRYCRNHIEEMKADACAESLLNKDVRKFWDSVYKISNCLLYTSPSPRDRQKSRMPSSA